MSKKSSKTVRLREIAEASGLHVSTVSLALRNDPRISEATRERAFRIAQELGYRPNPMVSALMLHIRNGRPSFQNNLAYLRTLEPGHRNLRSGYALNFFHGATERAKDLGYSLADFHLLDDGMKPERLEGIFRSRGIRGIIVEHLNPGDFPERSIPLDCSNFAVANIGLRLINPSYHFAANDQFTRPIVAMQHLLRLGYQRIGLALGKDADQQTSHRVSAGNWAFQRFLPKEIVVEPYLEQEDTDSELALLQWYRAERPEAIMGLGLDVPGMLRREGVEVPEDLGWATLDWFESLGSIAGVHANSLQIGKAAVELVAAQINQNEYGRPRYPKSVLYNSAWVDGDSVRRIGPPFDYGADFIRETIYQNAEESLA